MGLECLFIRNIQNHKGQVEYLSYIHTYPFKDVLCILNKRKKKYHNLCTIKTMLCLHLQKQKTKNFLKKFQNKKLQMQLEI